MSRDYQNSRTSYDPYNQDYDSGYSVQTNEYRDLYNPYKSIWQQAVKARFPKQLSGKGGHINPEEGTTFSPESDRPYRYGITSTEGGPGYERVRQSGKYSTYGKPISGEEQIFDSGYDVTRRNTYGNQTTGYGPRD